MAAPEPAFEARTVAVEGGWLEVFVGAGGGPWLCTTHPFVPAGGNSLETLRSSEYIRVLASVGRLVVVNPRGLGRSSAVGGPRELTLSLLADDLEAVRRALGVGRWVVAGGSSGAQVALLYALAHSDALDALLLFSMGPVGADILRSADALGSPRHPAHRDGLAGTALAVESSVLRTPGAEWRQLRGDLWSYWEDGRPRLVLPRRPGSPPPPRHRAALEEFGSFDVSSQLSQIGVPTLVVCGRRDDLVPLRECQRLAAIPGAEVIVLDGSGHGLEEIDRLEPILHRFLAARA